MEQKLEILNKLVSEGKVDLKDFYVVTMHRHDIKLQGEHSQEKMKKYSEFGEFIYDKDANYFDLNNGLLNITLTLS